MTIMKNPMRALAVVLTFNVLRLIKLYVTTQTNNSSNLLHLEFHAYYMTCPQP